MTVLSVGLFFSCSNPITRSLFEQSGRAHIYLPTNKEEKAGGILSEQVSFETKVDTIRTQDSNKTETDEAGMKSTTLEAFTVVADRPKLKISTIRNGKINLTFLMTMPKAFMDKRWQIVLTPRLLNDDKEIPLPPVVLKGEEFSKVQKAEFDKYNKFEQGIVDKSKYDSVFFNSKKHNRFMTDLQKQYFVNYRKEYRRILDYDKWRTITEERLMSYNTRLVGNYDQHTHDVALENLGKAYQFDLSGKDSAQVRRKYDLAYSPEAREKYLDRKRNSLTIQNVPRSYREIYLRGLTLDSLTNKSVTERDSLDVAAHTYDFKAIARNESKRDNQDIYRRHMVHFPLIDNAALSDSIKPGKDFVYLYSQDIEVTEDLARKLRVVVDTRVTAMDRSSWHQKGVDTLNFVISGMNDLVDRSLKDRLSESDQAIYQQGLDRLAVRDYRGALNIINQYPDYNSAVCLAALGYNDQAIMLLDRIAATGKADYLRAIVYARQKKLDDAKQSLLSAARKESTLAFKAEIEPEFTPLFAAYTDLAQQLTDIGDGLEE